MNQLPIIELKIKDLGSEVAAAIMLHREEISRQIEQGISHAIDTAPDKIMEIAKGEMYRVIESEISSYFRYGKGAEAIRQALAVGLEPLRKALAGEERKDEKR